MLYLKKIKTPLVIDSREPKDLIKLFEESLLFEQIEVRELDVGDFDFGCLRIERKSLSDFINSWRSGRLDSQIERLLALENQVGIIIIHDYSKASPWIDKGLRMAAMKHIENLNMTLPVFKTKNVNTLMNKIIAFAKHAQDGEYVLNFTGRKTKVKPAANRIVYFYSSLPGVSEVLAERLYKRFPIPIKLFQKIHRLSKKKKAKAWHHGIKGIGSGKATEIEAMLLEGKEE